MNSRCLLASISLFVLLLSGSCRERQAKQVIETPEITFTKEGELFLFQSESDSLLAQLDIEIANTEYETQTGLMYRKGMEQDQAMFFVFDYSGMHSFYMKNTEFAIDIIFVDEELHVASFKDNAQPLDETGISSQVPVKYVLEVNAGLREKWGLAVGDSISFTTE